MKKVHVNVSVKTSDNLEISRRLCRYITELTKKLEDQRSRALTVIDLFSPTGEALRSKLRDYCERLIVDDPINHVQKTEELLWRRGFYDIVSAAKKLRKGNSWNDIEKAFLSAHLSVGVGFYHHLILRLQLEYNLDLIGVIDFAYTQSLRNPKQGEKTVNQVKAQTPEVTKCVCRLIHRSLICLGDLERYRLDLDSNWDSQVAIRYYKMAVDIDGNYGMPYNQLGTVASSTNYGLDAVFYYMRSSLCKEPFEGSEGNLKRTIIVHSLNGKEKCVTQCCIARLLLLLQLWDNDSINFDQINQESQKLLNDIENCLNVEKSENIDHQSAKNEDSIEKYLSYYKNDETKYLTDDMIFKIIMICFMKISKIQIKESRDGHSVIAFVLAIFSQLLQFVVIRLQESLLDMSRTNSYCESNKINGIKESIEKRDSKKEQTENNENEKDLHESLKNNIEKNCNETMCSNVNGKSELNGNCLKKMVKKSRTKSKSLLTKLRRPRNCKNSSDSDASDGEETALGSSSEDVNSDISETEEDGMSDDNILSDEAMSEDLTDDEKPNETDTVGTDALTKEINGRSDMNEKFVEENENENTNIVNKETVENGKNVPKNETSANCNYDENSTSANTLTYVAQMEKQNLDPINILKVLNDERILISIKVCCDWLQGNEDIIQTCAKGSKTLLKRLITLLNLINLDSESLLEKWEKDSEIFLNLEKGKEAIEVVPLPEDIDMRGLKSFEFAHTNINWKILKRKRMTHCEETLLRVMKIIRFGHHLCLVRESGVAYDDVKGLFIISTPENSTKDCQNDKNFELDTSKGKLMRHMGRLWLKAEVRALESRLHYRLMSPYLVPDHEAFAKFMPLIKHLVYAKKFIVVVPSVVICALDELKKISSHAREATRWIENQLQRGSRFLRAQRPHETLPLPFIKGPKPKDKDAWQYFQIIECCHYLTQQSKAGDAEIPVVTLLTGNDDKRELTYSPDGLAGSAGVNFEHISTFHAKWKVSFKSHG